MTGTPDPRERADRVRRALAHPDARTRLAAALAAGTAPAAEQVAELVRRSAVEPDFFVRDMLTWALTRHDRGRVLPMLHVALSSPVPQARSQALHTLSKIADPATWPWITADLLGDPDDDTARSAWRAAVALVPEPEVPALGDILGRAFGRGDHAMKRSLSRAFAELGDRARGAVRTAAHARDPSVREHAAATERLMDDPESDFALDLDEARRIAATGTRDDE